MTSVAPQLFHIPVMGLGFTIDTPLKVARFGISSVLSIVEDELLERMREFYCKAESLAFQPLSNKDIDAREKRITAYLNLLGTLVKKQVDRLRKEPFSSGTEIMRYFDMLPDHAADKQLYQVMLESQGAKRRSEEHTSELQ